MIAVITAIAALVFVCCLLGEALRRRRRNEPAPARRHRRAWRQPPNPTLRHALATAGTHGLGMVKRGAS